jgi:hypothetical protein
MMVVVTVITQCGSANRLSTSSADFTESGFRLDPRNLFNQHRTYHVNIGE